MIDFRKMLKTSEKFVIDNSPVIMTAVGVTGTLTTAYLVGKASFKAADILRGAENVRSFQEKAQPIETKEKVKLVWKEYIPAGVTTAVTVSCIIGANRVSTRRAAAIASAYTLSERAFSEYKDKIAEKLGEKKAHGIQQEVDQDKVNNLPEGQSVIITGRGDNLFMDSMSNWQFRSTMEAIDKAVNDINFEIINDGYASLSEFYDKLKIPHTAISDEVGWNTDQRLEVSKTAVIANNGEACVVINYQAPPFRRYDKTYP